MINQNEQFPKIRFHNYCDEWKQQKLGEVFEQTVEYVDPCEQNLELWSVTVESGLTPKEERYNREFLVKKSDKFKKLYPEEIVYNPMNITIGAVGFNNAGKEVAVSGYYVTMKMKSQFSNKFFSAWLSCPKAIRLYKIYSTGSLIERQRVQFPTLSDIRDYFPTFEEQTAIGSLFSTLDDLLESYKYNLIKYQSFKVTMLSKMFPKAGQRVPEIRLDGFEGEWEIVKLGDNCRIITGGTPRTGVKEFWSPKEIPWMSSGEINKKILNETEEMISCIGLENSSAKWVKQNSVLIALAGQGQTRGRVAINKIPLTTNQSIAAIETNDNIDFLFLYTDLSRRYDELRLISSGDGTRGGLNKTIISKLELNLPGLDEQQAIGAYFSNLDNLISSHQEKISQLEILKKKLLQDMFI